MFSQLLGGVVTELLRRAHLLTLEFMHQVRFGFMILSVDLLLYLYCVGMIILLYCRKFNTITYVDILLVGSYGKFSTVNLLGRRLYTFLQFSYTAAGLRCRLTLHPLHLGCVE